jgi:hypothetical protein
MKLLRINDSTGEYLGQDGKYLPIDKIGKDDLIRLVGRVLEEADSEFDDYDESLLRHQVHQVIYKNIHGKLRSLAERRSDFADQSARLFLDDYQKYRDEAAGKG